jgi:hypothetical protein
MFGDTVESRYDMHGNYSCKIFVKKPDLKEIDMAKKNSHAHAAIDGRNTWMIACISPLSRAVK